MALQFLLQVVEDHTIAEYTLIAGSGLSLGA